MRETRIRILFVTCALVCTGIVMIFSASAIYAYESFGDSAYFLKRHLLYLLIGTVCAFLVMSFDYGKLRKYAKPILFITLFCLCLVLIPGIGKQTSGARRWFKLWIFTIQPAEFAKLAIILYLADFLSRKQPKIKSFIQGFLPPAIAMGMTMGLVLLQPDLGTAVDIGLISFIMLMVAGVNFAHISSIALASLPVFYALVFHVAYRRRRILAFLNPWEDPRGVGFQIIQSFLALGQGGLIGVGLGHSKQKLFYLPQSYTDFIFSIIGEEMGFLGALAVIAMFAYFIWQCAKVALKAKDLFGQLLCLGIFSMIAIEALINIAVTIGAIPTKGLPLPFISYGGSSLICKLIGVGLILNVAKNRTDQIE